MIFCNQSFSHNVPIINGCGQEAGQEYRARNCRLKKTKEGGELFLDIAGAYNVPGLSSLERYFHFDLHSGILIMRDTFRFSGKTLPVTERFISLSAPVVEAGALFIEHTSDGDTHKTMLTGNVVQDDPLGFRVLSPPVIGTVLHRDHAGRDVVVHTIDYPLQYDEYRAEPFSVEFVLKHQSCR
jgi:hypothetical protein